MMDRIISEEQYQETLARIEVFLKRGSKNLTFEEKELLLQISVLAEAYEQEVCPMPMQPQSLLGMIQVKMFERRLKQKELASLLEISETTLSEILNGKRKINLDLAKKLYKRMGISADFILEAV